MCQGSDNVDYKAFFEDMSSPRMRTYQKAFKPADDKQLLGAYLWGQAVGAAFQPFISLTEVTLRNAIHTSLSSQLSGGKSSSYAWYDRALASSLPLTGKTHDMVEEVLCDRNKVRLATQPTPDAVVASLSFGVWSDVLASQLTDLTRGQTFTEVFTHHPHSKKSYWVHAASRVPVVDRVKKLQRLRNRVSHFEPVWSPTMLEGNSGRSWSHAVQALAGCSTEFVELLGWISPAAAQVYKTSFPREWLARLISTNAVKAFMHDPFRNGGLAPLNLPPMAPAAVPAGAPTSPADTQGR